MNSKTIFSLKESLFDRLRALVRVARYYRKHMLPNLHMLEKTMKLRGINNGCGAFIFGCGPSINSLDLQKIKELRQRHGFKIFAVNAFITSDFSKEMVPDYYLLSDPANFDMDKFTDYRATAKLTWDRIKQYQLPVFTPVDLHHYVEYSHKFVFCDLENLYSRNVANPLRPRGFVSLSVMKAIQMAIFMGHAKIYICGVDHDHSKTLHVNKENRLIYDETHFYDGHKTRQTVEWKNGNMTDMFYGGYLGFESYSRFAEHPIINLNPDSFVDCFTKQHNLDVYKTI